ncbi:hypothetical protein DLJ54_02160 [Corynebacterium heidelbergense]|uniref:SWIM-type domain-containing protein n=1 Tax=Corynebacterium heidelbergense TaxID=2055947 RepID=A0A364V7R3_9CORY|nr:hypothetical protein DLJ54_02160 [Corynebacterium heidelbergense]
MDRHNLDHPRRSSNRPSARRGSPRFSAWGENVVVADFGAQRRAELEQRHGPGSSSGKLPFIEAEGWVPRQLMEALSEGADSGRLARGREYYRGKQVLSVDLDTNLITAVVAGTQLVPFEVQLRFRPLSPRQRTYVTEEVAADPSIVRSVLAGSAPPLEIATVLLRPDHLRSVTCTCPDKAAVCKHAVAVGYAAAALFNREPFQVFRFRGVDASDALAATQRSWSGPAGVPQSDGGDRVHLDTVERVDPAEFWGGGLTRVETPEMSVEEGLELGDRDMLMRALRTVSWSHVDQLRVWHDLEVCYEALTDQDPELEERPWRH